MVAFLITRNIKLKQLFKTIVSMKITEIQSQEYKNLILADELKNRWEEIEDKIREYKFARIQYPKDYNYHRKLSDEIDELAIKYSNLNIV